jgi:hypothetical protein
MTLTESLLNRIRKSWELWGIIISYFIVARFNFVMRDIITVENIATNQLALGTAWILISILITIIRVYADITRK